MGAKKDKKSSVESVRDFLKAFSDRPTMTEIDEAFKNDTSSGYKTFKEGYTNRRNGVMFYLKEQIKTTKLNNISKISNTAEELEKILKQLDPKNWMKLMYSAGEILGNIQIELRSMTEDLKAFKTNTQNSEEIQKLCQSIYIAIKIVSIELKQNESLLKKARVSPDKIKQLNDSISELEKTAKDIFLWHAISSKPPTGENIPNTKTPSLDLNNHSVTPHLENNPIEAYPSSDITQLADYLNLIYKDHKVNLESTHGYCLQLHDQLNTISDLKRLNQTENDLNVLKTREISIKQMSETLINHPQIPTYVKKDFLNILMGATYTDLEPLCKQVKAFIDISSKLSGIKTQLEAALNELKTYTSKLEKQEAKEKTNEFLSNFFSYFNKLFIVFDYLSKLYTSLGLTSSQKTVGKIEQKIENFKNIIEASTAKFEAYINTGRLETSINEFFKPVDMPEWMPTEALYDTPEDNINKSKKFKSDLKEKIVEQNEEANSNDVLNPLHHPR